MSKDETIRQDHWHVWFGSSWGGEPYWQVRRVYSGGSMALPGGGSEAAALQKLAEMRANGICVECGDVLHTGYMEPYATRIVEQQTCMSCLHWIDLLAIRDRADVARAGGSHYQIGPDSSSPSQCRGFGGARVVVNFTDGRSVTTTNLWTQGEIPEHFRDRLPDNATLDWTRPKPFRVETPHVE